MHDGMEDLKTITNVKALPSSSLKHYLAFESPLDEVRCT